MLGEGHHAETRVDVPYFDLAVIGGRDDPLPFWRIRYGVHRIEMALLLEDVGL